VPNGPFFVRSGATGPIRPLYPDVHRRPDPHVPDGLRRRSGRGNTGKRGGADDAGRGGRVSQCPPGATGQVDCLTRSWPSARCLMTRQTHPHRPRTGPSCRWEASSPRRCSSRCERSRPASGWRLASIKTALKARRLLRRAHGAEVRSLNVRALGSSVARWLGESIRRLYVKPETHSAAHAVASAQ